ncbi:hypothetical protein H1C71_042492 [Ictidomys tridecemlineatus]|nr:hypothetical protein H1C71_042492 [Ictidomys tridecemlineatus]
MSGSLLSCLNLGSSSSMSDGAFRYPKRTKCTFWEKYKHDLYSTLSLDLGLSIDLFFNLSAKLDLKDLLLWKTYHSAAGRPSESHVWKIKKKHGMIKDILGSSTSPFLFL